MIIKRDTITELIVLQRTMAIQLKGIKFFIQVIPLTFGCSCVCFRYNQSSEMTVKQILSVSDDGGKKTLRLHEENLQQLLEEDTANIPVVVISVTGAYRTGKSFLLNSMMRYIAATDKSRWLDNKSESFAWKSGYEQHTNGLSMSSPMQMTLPSGEKVALVLIDSQGLFDRDSSVSDLVNIFSLSTLVSSLQVSNIMQDLKGSDLGYLQLFAEFGRLVSDNFEGKPFQDLLFLIRDWHHTQDYALGRQGGASLVDQRLSSSNQSVRKEREQFKDCFTSVSGFLLPFPGQKVAGSPEFDGAAEDMDPEFRTALEDFMTDVLSPDKLTVKMNGERPMTCRQLATFIRTYVKRLEGGGLVKAEGILQAFAEATNMAVVEEEFRSYVERMEHLLTDDASLLTAQLLTEKHQKVKTDCLESFKRRKIMKDPAKSEDFFLSSLKEKIGKWFKSTSIFTEKLQSDLEKVCAHNMSLLPKCIAKYKESIESSYTQYSKLNPLRYLPSREATIRDNHKAAKARALELYDEEAFDAANFRMEIRRCLELALDNILDEAVCANKKVQICWAVGIGVTCVIVGGVVMSYYGWSVPAVLKELEQTISRVIVHAIRRTGDVLIETIDALGPQDIPQGAAAAIFVFLCRQHSEKQ